MKVQIVSFHCVLKNNLGQWISSSFNEDVVAATEVEGSEHLHGLIEGLKGVKTGDKKQIYVSADQAYGFYRPEWFREIPRDEIMFGRKLKKGDEVRAKLTPDGVSRNFRVVDTTNSGLILDANHPLAGQDLVFDIEVTSSYEELENLEEPHVLLN
jgi:FKBP-type peptidyl-prolyl cis-trans isomerase SlyD